jgi:hypothetical protein
MVIENHIMRTQYGWILMAAIDGRSSEFFGTNLRDVIYLGNGGLFQDMYDQFHRQTLLSHADENQFINEMDATTMRLAGFSAFPNRGLGLPSPEHWVSTRAFWFLLFSTDITSHYKSGSTQHRDLDLLNWPMFSRTFAG